MSKPERYRSMDLKGAQEICGHPNTLLSRACPVCRWAIILHCPECTIQITGCRCTAEERMAPADFEAFMKTRKLRGTTSE